MAPREAHRGVDGPSMKVAHLTSQYPKLSHTFFDIVDLADPPADRPLKLGASGTTATYTQHSKPWHILRKIVIRFEAG
jgi:hypothetical protein